MAYCIVLHKLIIYNLFRELLSSFFCALYTNTLMNYIKPLYIPYISLLSTIYIRIIYRRFNLL